jgi:hypothetical protein
MAAKDSKVNSELDSVMADLLKSVKNNQRDVTTGKTTEIMTLTDKMKVIDRVLKWEAIKSKLNDEGWGGGFNDEK